MATYRCFLHEKPVIIHLDARTDRVAVHKDHHMREHFSGSGGGFSLAEYEAWRREQRRGLAVNREG